MYKQLGLMILFFLMIGGETHAASPASLVSKGNRLYLDGKYDDALSAYEEASVQAPESPQIYFNSGAAYYRKKDYEKAKEAFENTALKTKNIRLEAMAHFNLGNCLFGEGQRQKDSDLNKALEAFQTSIRQYQKALTLDPGLKEAAENIEVVRLVMKNILDEINKQKEAAAKDQAAVEKLKKLIQQQQELLDRNNYLSDEKAQQGDSPALKNKILELANDQKAVEKETRDLAPELSPTVQKSLSPQAPSKREAAKQHLETAADEQENAAGKITAMQTSAARENQKNAQDELNKALASLSGDNGQQGRQNSQKAEGSDKDKGKNNVKKDAQEDQGQNQEQNKEAHAPQKQEGTGKEIQQPAMPEGDAQSILDEEKENLRQRRATVSGGYSEVDRDW